MVEKISRLPANNFLLQANLSGKKPREVSENPELAKSMTGRTLKEFVAQTRPVVALIVGGEAEREGDGNTKSEKRIELEITYGGRVRQQDDASLELVQSFTPEAIIANAVTAKPTHDPRSVAAYPLLECWQERDAADELLSSAVLKQTVRHETGLPEALRNLDMLIGGVEEMISRLEQSYE